MTKNVLVVGGAGYIGSHVCLDLADKGFVPVVYDNLSGGHADFVQWGPLEEGDIRDAARLDSVFARYKPIAVIHLAALTEVGQSTKQPLAFFENNVSGTIALLSAATRAGTDKFVFSSTCAIYGIPQVVPIPETHPRAPINPYGQSKYIVEMMLEDLSAHFGVNYVSLRYFNAAGADPAGRVGERHTPETHIVPLAIQAALGKRPGFTVFGTDYDTPDGTCVRDFIHVMDLADSHTRALQYLLDGGRSEAFNLGTGAGTSVRELLTAVAKASGCNFPITSAERRDGDSPVLVADNSKAGLLLGWSARHDLQSIVETALQWHSRAV